MLNPLDNYFEQKDEPIKSCLQHLRSVLLAYADVTEHWKYGMPFYYFKGKMFCYLWIHKKLLQPYIGLVDGNKIDDEDLLQEKRARMKILLVDHLEDIPKDKIESILNQAFALRN
ncbi:DUF1801 domain-containing protein [Pedobacter paludis]|uniref:YdhG-like domain-containing protein n=1 Tax=Pedobacter paludis TaxID=2203212 RepID=A0A317EXA3_9SPHI|nr:DUF1801 domain-containing protein [Pedobacter paludis]PWS29878.1 hypothetical protein DF947_20025 [Pedobacter paludis]